MPETGYGRPTKEHIAALKRKWDRAAARKQARRDAMTAAHRKAKGWAA